MSSATALTQLPQNKTAAGVVSLQRSRLAPYVLAVILFAASSALMYVGDVVFVRFGFPWTLIYLLVVAATANKWGTGPALMVLALSSLFGDVIVPDLHLSYLYTHGLPDDVRLIRMLLFAACGGANIWLTHQVQRTRERSERRKAVLTMLHRMILPEHLAAAPGYDISAVYQPARREEEVGGDFYDFYPTGNGTFGLLIGDVMGKGKEAAASTALLRYSIRALTSKEASPGRVLSQVNDLLEAQPDRFTATLFLGVLDQNTGLLRFASAGHEPPLLRRADGQEVTLESTGPIFGVGMGIPYEEDVITLNPGDALLLMTDGVTEARNQSGEFLGCDGVWRLLHSARFLPAASTMLAQIETGLMKFAGRTNRDDIAMVLLRRTSWPHGHHGIARNDDETR